MCFHGSMQLYGVDYIVGVIATYTHKHTHHPQTMRYAQDEDSHLLEEGDIIREKSELQQYRYKDPDTRTSDNEP